MPTLDGYKQFSAAHWETGSIKNVLAHHGLLAPHTREPFTEALLLGLSGGVTSMYFVFEYEGYEPHLFIGTRYPFNPMDAIYNRLGIQPNVRETTSRDKAADNLTAALSHGNPAIVWANVHALRYNALSDLQFPGMMPIVVYGYDEAEQTLNVADRSRLPLTCTAADLVEARAAQGSLKNRLITLNPPSIDEAGLANAVEESIRACLTLNLQGPEKGPKSNFGLPALLKWADLVTDSRDKKGWPRLFSPGPHMYAALTWAFQLIEQWGAGGSASRPMYAAFLDEASDLLSRPALRDVAEQFRSSGELWSDLAEAMLPDQVPPLAETRALLLRKGALFQEQGMSALPEMEQIAANLSDLKSEMATAFPLTEAEAAAMRDTLRERILGLHDAERAAFLALQDALS